MVRGERERCERACRDEAENGVFSFFFWPGRIKKSEDRHGGDVRSKCESNSKVGPSPHARS